MSNTNNQTPGKEPQWIKVSDFDYPPIFKVGQMIRLYGKYASPIKAIEVHYNEGIEDWEPIVIIEGRGDPLVRSLDVIEILEPQPTPGKVEGMTKEEILNEIVSMYEECWKSNKGKDPKFQATLFGEKVGLLVVDNLLNQPATQSTGQEPAQAEVGFKFCGACGQEKKCYAERRCFADTTPAQTPPADNEGEEQKEYWYRIPEKDLKSHSHDDKLVWLSEAGKYVSQLQQTIEQLKEDWNFLQDVTQSQAKTIAEKEQEAKKWMGCYERVAADKFELMQTAGEQGDTIQSQKEQIDSLRGALEAAPTLPASHFPDHFYEAFRKWKTEVAALQSPPTRESGKDETPTTNEIVEMAKERFPDDGNLFKAHQFAFVIGYKAAIQKAQSNQ